MYRFLKWFIKYTEMINNIFKDLQRRDYIVKEYNNKTIYE